jgi:hypothetical protein
MSRGFQVALSDPETKSRIELAGLGQVVEQLLLLTRPAHALHITLDLVARNMQLNVIPKEKDKVPKFPADPTLIAAVNSLPGGITNCLVLPGEETELYIMPSIMETFDLACYRGDNGRPCLTSFQMGKRAAQMSHKTNHLPMVAQAVATTYTSIDHYQIIHANYAMMQHQIKKESASVLQTSNHKALFVNAKDRDIIVFIQYGYDQLILTNGQTIGETGFKFHQFEDVGLSFAISSGLDGQQERQRVHAFFSPLPLDEHPKFKPDLTLIAKKLNPISLQHIAVSLEVIISGSSIADKLVDVTITVQVNQTGLDR